MTGRRTLSHKRRISSHQPLSASRAFLSSAISSCSTSTESRVAGGPGLSVRIPPCLRPPGRPSSRSADMPRSATPSLDRAIRFRTLLTLGLFQLDSRPPRIEIWWRLSSRPNQRLTGHRQQRLFCFRELFPTATDLPASCRGSRWCFLQGGGNFAREIRDRALDAYAPG